MNPERIFRYATHERVLDYLLLGWHIACADLGPPHGQYAVLLEWLCACPRAEPRVSVR
jgi:hypothetical protein